MQLRQRRRTPSCRGSVCTGIGTGAAWQLRAKGREDAPGRGWAVGCRSGLGSVSQRGWESRGAGRGPLLSQGDHSGGRGLGSITVRGRAQAIVGKRTVEGKRSLVASGSQRLQWANEVEGTKVTLRWGWQG